MNKKSDIQKEMKKLIEIESSPKKKKSLEETIEERLEYYRNKLKEDYEELIKIQSKIESDEDSIYIYKEMKSLVNKSFKK